MEIRVNIFYVHLLSFFQFFITILLYTLTHITDSTLYLMTSRISSRIEYLIPTNNIPVFRLHSTLLIKASFTVFNKI